MRNAIPTAMLAVLGGALTLGCVERTPGLTVIVQIDPHPVASLAMPGGALSVDSALLFVDRVELSACDEAIAAPARAWHSWLVGAARAHGNGVATGLSASVGPQDALDGDPREIARFAVPPDVAWCALQLASGEGTGIALAGRLDGAPESWLAPFESAPRIPFPALHLDADRRTATITLRFALEDWAADLPPTEEPGPSLAANAAAALTAHAERR